MSRGSRFAHRFPVPTPPPLLMKRAFAFSRQLKKLSRLLLCPVCGLDGWVTDLGNNEKRSSKTVGTEHFTPSGCLQVWEGRQEALWVFQKVVLKRMILRTTGREPVATSCIWLTPTPRQPLLRARAAASPQPSTQQTGISPRQQ